MGSVALLLRSFFLVELKLLLLPCAMVISSRASEVSAALDYFPFYWTQRTGTRFARVGMCVLCMLHWKNVSITAKKRPVHLSPPSWTFYNITAEGETAQGIVQELLRVLGSTSFLQPETP